jgi:alpha-1,3-mannosyltransferase
MNPRPFFPPYNVRFRRGAPKSLLSMEWECQASESSFISWDFWKVCRRGAVRCRGHRPLRRLPDRQGDTMNIADWQYGFGRILTVPGVHACYGKGDAQLRGWVEFPAPTTLNEMVTWQDK